MENLRKVIIDGNEIEVDPAMTILQACETIETQIPRFCYHERLSIAGNCRMCLVEVVGGPPKPTASCAMQVRDLRPGPNGELPVIKTNSAMVKKAREGVMEFLLINHPLDCPICDQGGECDLQDQAVAYGVDFSRYREPKRAALELNLGPLVGTAMTRCISCTRCVRFTTEIAGISQMGQTGRGEDSEITSYLNETLKSNLQGNIIDLCPVGALTSKPYSFTARPWELTKTESIDVMDALGSNIRIDTKGAEVMRILPLNHDCVNEEWISDKTRFIWDGLRTQRLDQPYVRKNGKLTPVSWEEAFRKIKSAVKDKKIAGLAGDLAPVESVFALGALLDKLEGTKECRVDGAQLPIGNRGAYAGTAAIEDFDDAEFIQLIGCNPRLEAPVLNARIRQAWARGANIGLVGEPVDLTYDYAHVGTDPGALRDLLTHEFGQVLESKSIICIGQGALAREDGAAILADAVALCEATKSQLFVLHTAASRVGAMDLGFATQGGMKAALKDADVVYNLGADEIEMPDDCFVIYQGSHGDRGAHRADVILPGACYTEENAIFVNMEGRPQIANRAAMPPGNAKENWAIIRALSAVLNKKLSFDNIDQLRAQMYEVAPHFAQLDEVPRNKIKKLRAGGKISSEALRSPIQDYYMTNPIARASQVMAELSRMNFKPSQEAAQLW